MGGVETPAMKNEKARKQRVAKAKAASGFLGPTRWGIPEQVDKDDVRKESVRDTLENEFGKHGL